MKKMICFGDSITAGWDGVRVHPILNEKLASGLRGWQIRNAGVPGDTTEKALDRMDRDVLRHPYDMVTVLFGANDSSYHKGIPLLAFQNHLIRMTEAISAEKIILITPAPVIDQKQKGKRLNERVSIYAASVRRVAEETGSPLIDLHRRMMQLSSFQPLLQEDGLHFTHSGYDFLSALIIEKVNALEGKSKIQP
ncbi:GDSL family lipase [Sporolactobacillus sp. THM7-4]|nr:GDSL family lipase [Sporolactobacillus sp. THM7-4]